MTMTEMRDDAGFVKRSRAKLKLTQSELADELGIERRSILRYERGDDLPPYMRRAIKNLLDETLKRRRGKKG